VRRGQTPRERSTASVTLRLSSGLAFAQRSGSRFSAANVLTQSNIEVSVWWLAHCFFSPCTSRSMR
jgi:hypothetical protein